MEQLQWLVRDRSFYIKHTLEQPTNLFFIIAGKDLANPTALLLSGIMMLKHMRLYEEAANIEKAVFKTLAEGKTLTGDLGGRATNTEYTQAVIAVSRNIKEN